MAGLQLTQFKGFFPWERITIDIQHLSLSQIKLFALPTLVSFVVGWIVWHVVYNLYFHPLAKFPGPKLAAISPLWYAYYSFVGLMPQANKRAHDKYGSIVRIAPNELSICNVSSWKEVYGSNQRGKVFLKSEFYETKEIDNGLNHIVNERNPVRHGEMRRMLWHAFTPRAIMEQEGIIQGYVDLLISTLGKHYGANEKGPDGEYCNLVKWYNYTTFDIIGDLAFGETGAFECLKNARNHTWVASMMNILFMIIFPDILRRFPGMLKLGLWLTPASIKNKKTMLNNFGKELVAKRVQATNTDRKDFWQYILNREESKGISIEALAIQAQILILAGSETSATMLSGTTFYLLKTPHALKRLNEEVRGAFECYSEITAKNTEALEYLNAVIEEGLRIYPPAAFGLPRTSPGANVSGHYIPKGVVVSLPMYTITRDPTFWSNPNEFSPERWIDPKNTDIREASQPFSLGPRGCIGKNLALTEIRIILAKLIYCFDFELVNPNLDWMGESKAYAVWLKPDLLVKMNKRPGIVWGDKDDLPL